ncbi:MAG: bifunctional response regulator/alkaline phosphatase family protein [Gemmatimonadota bacterium]|jgi:DNA-binding response OmpR family regulator|nr:bifunctional response regulator/alkaline phosphatase family protein [Gemmatimonadota bacterium]
MTVATKRLLWVDDEIDLLRPHLLFVQGRGYHIDAVANGDDALELVRLHPYDLILLDEQMPGRTGMEVFDEVRRLDPHVPVVMVTKSEEDRTMTEAIGRRVSDYLVKPTSPRQILSVVTRLLEGETLLQQHVAREFSYRFRELNAEITTERTWREWMETYSELVDWELRLRSAGEIGLVASLETLLGEFRREFGRFVTGSYGDWVNGEEHRPPLSIDLVPQFLCPLLAEDRHVLFVVIDCLRLDQWRSILPLFGAGVEVEEALYYSILPTATPYSRNAIFSGMFPDAIAEEYPDWWSREMEGSLNAFEDQLFIAQLQRLTGRQVPVNYEKIFTAADGAQALHRLPGYLSKPGVTALVFNFVDMLTHGRSESTVLMEVARDKEALRALSRQWFARSEALAAVREAIRMGVSVLITTDHGSIHCHRPVTVYAKRDATQNLRYKFGDDLRAEDPSLAFAVNDERILRFPRGKEATNYVLGLEDSFFVYPTKLRQYQARYRGSFLHGGISPEEMILPVALLTPR